MTKDVADWCGFDSILQMLKTHLEVEELIDLLGEYIYENSEMVDDLVKDIAAEKYNWFDREQAIADREDAEYQAWKERGL